MIFSFEITKGPYRNIILEFTNASELYFSLKEKNTNHY
jgi:hypothetical protein